MRPAPTIDASIAVMHDTALKALPAKSCRSASLTPDKVPGGIHKPCKAIASAPVKVRQRWPNQYFPPGVIVGTLPNKVEVLDCDMFATNASG